MPKKLELWSCSYCSGFKQSKKEHVLKHEARCFSNPNNKACRTCKFMAKRLRTKEEKEMYVGFVYECKKKNIFLYTKPDEAGCKRKVNIDSKTREVMAAYNTGTMGMEKTNGLLFPTSNCSDHKKKKLK